MKSSAATLACLALVALVQADLPTLFREVRAQLTSAEDAVRGLVNDVHAKGPGFAKCSADLLTATGQALAAANDALDVCEAKADVALATPPCLTKDVACLNHINASQVETLAEAGRCMVLAVRGVEGIVARMSSEVDECDRRTSEPVRLRRDTRRPGPGGPNQQVQISIPLQKVVKEVQRAAGKVHREAKRFVSKIRRRFRG